MSACTLVVSACLFNILHCFLPICLCRTHGIVCYKQKISWKVSEQKLEVSSGRSTAERLCEGKQTLLWGALDGERRSNIMW